jgi:hypothetical protein
MSASEWDVLVKAASGILIIPLLAFAGAYFGAWLNKRNKAFEIKGKILEDYSRSMWKVILTSIHLSADSKTGEFSDKVLERHNRIFDCYDQAFPDLYMSIRTEISKASAYITKELFKSLQKFYETECVALDTANRRLHGILNSQVSSENKHASSKSHYEYVRLMKARADELINQLVIDLGISTNRQPLDGDEIRKWLKESYNDESHQWKPPA